MLNVAFSRSSLGVEAVRIFLCIAPQQHMLGCVLPQMSAQGWGSLKGGSGALAQTVGREVSQESIEITSSQLSCLWSWLFATRARVFQLCVWICGTKVVIDKRMGGRLNSASLSVLSYVSHVRSPKVTHTFCSVGLT